MIDSVKPVLLSLKPNYADLVFSGLKTAELRRRIPRIKNQDVFVYVSSPEKILRGGFRISRVWEGSPEEIWGKVSKLARINKTDFDSYYKGSNIAYALIITKVWEYKNPANLTTLRKRFSSFVAPQSWRYINCKEYRSFQQMKIMSPKAA